MYISDTAAHVFAISAGQISLLSAVRGFTLAIDSKDRLYSGNSSSLIRFSSAGGAEDLSTWLKRSGIQHIGAIGVDAADNVYVASGVQNAVHAYPFYQFTPSGVSHPLQSTFDQVNSIAITAGGNIWLAAGFLMNAQGYFLGQ